jgi:hypothetical protein
MKKLAFIFAAMLAVLASGTAKAGITLTTSPTGPSGSAFAGVDPITDPQSQGIYEIDLQPTGGNYTSGGTTLNFNTVSLVQSYTPVTGPASNIISALGDSTTVTIRNVSGPAVTLTLTVTYDAFNYPSGNPLNWISTITTSRLDGGATFGSTESVYSGAGYGTLDSSVTHTTLTAPGTESITKSVSPGRPFEVVQTLTVYLPTGAVANIQKSDTFATPEPATYVAALTALPLVGFGLWRRRRAK